MGATTLTTAHHHVGPSLQDSRPHEGQSPLTANLLRSSAHPSQVQCGIFSTIFNPTGERLGNKILRQRLKGPALAAYYPRRVATFKDLQRLYPGFETYNEFEEDRLEHLQIAKSRGKGAPKKKRTAAGESVEILQSVSAVLNTMLTDSLQRARSSTARRGNRGFWDFDDGIYCMEFWDTVHENRNCTVWPLECRPKRRQRLPFGSMSTCISPFSSQTHLPPALELCKRSLPNAGLQLLIR